MGELWSIYPVGELWSIYPVGELWSIYPVGELWSIYNQWVSLNNSLIVSVDMVPELLVLPSALSLFLYG